MSQWISTPVTPHQLTCNPLGIPHLALLWSHPNSSTNQRDIQDFLVRGFFPSPKTQYSGQVLVRMERKGKACRWKKTTKSSHAQNAFYFFLNWNSKFQWRIWHETVPVFWWWHLCHAHPKSQRWQSQLRHLQPQTPKTFLPTLHLKFHWEASGIPQDSNQSPVALKA